MSTFFQGILPDTAIPILFFIFRVRAAACSSFVAISRGGLGNLTKSAIIELTFSIKKKKYIYIYMF